MTKDICDLVELYFRVEDRITQLEKELKKISKTENLKIKNKRESIIKMCTSYKKRMKKLSNDIHDLSEKENIKKSIKLTNELQNYLNVITDEIIFLRIL